MSPGVASITFEQVFDVNDSNSRVFQTSLTGAIDDFIGGKAVTLIATGATNAGKSFACHGDQERPSSRKFEPGLITLAIRRVFSNLESEIKDGGKCNVLLSCWGIGRSGTSNPEALVDLLAAGTSVTTEDMEKAMVDHSLVVRTPAEAVHLYSKALERVKCAEKQDFVFVLHVETLSPHGEARRGRLVVMDIHGGSIVEPRGEVASQTQKKTRGEYFLDTQFPVNETLSAGFGPFVGNTSSTYVLVAIQTPAPFQQQAIQSLLYACKAKEIKSSCSINCIPSSIEKNNANQPGETPNRLPMDAENQSPGCREDYDVPKSPPPSSVDQCAGFHTNRTVSPVSPPLSTTSNSSTSELPHQAREPVMSPILSPSTSCESEESLKQSTVSRRVRRAYDIAKAATSSPLKSSAVSTASSNQTGDSTAHAAVNELLKHLSPDSLRGLSLQAKCEQIRTTQAELERALAHEISIKDKCVDRISRLSQTMSCQVVEHEQQLHEALTAKHAAESQLQDLTVKFDDVGREVTRLQEEVRLLKAGSAAAPTSENERSMLHTLSTRLEEAMIQAKDVITYKDGVIQSLKERLQLASKRGADTIALLQQERSEFEREKTNLLAQLQQSKDSSASKKDEEVSRLQAENMALEQQKAALTVKVAQLTLELETARSQWTQDARDREHRAEKRCEKQVAQAEEQLEQATTAMQQQMAQFRAELDMKVAKQRVAAQVACRAGELKCAGMERELQRMKVKLAKQKVKMDKKTRALVASAQQEHKEPVEMLKRELEALSGRLIAAVEREQEAIRRAEESEDAGERLEADVQRLKTSASELERERAVLGNLYKDLEADKDAVEAKLELRKREMEQSLAQQIMAVEARVNKERDDQVQTLIDQHNVEVDRLSAEARDREERIAELTQLARHSSSSAASEDGSLTSDSSRQKSIDELDALIVAKERRYRHLEKRSKASSSSRSPSSSPPTEKASSCLKRELTHKEEKIAELSARQKELLVALATANEQETRAKQQAQETKTQRENELAQYEDALQQLNSLKRENWNLSLALHVTEASKQQRKAPQANLIY
ncbi:Kinesin motor domain [Phytophthora infestans]|nr:Kinesin motor domain [Phytophthora infestans]